MDLINVSEVSKHFNKVATDPKLWEDYDLGKKCLRDKKDLIALPRFRKLKTFKFSKNNNEDFYTKDSINTLLEAMMKMSFDKIIFDKFTPRGVNDIFADVITKTKTVIFDADGHYDLGRAQLRKLFEKVPGGNIKRLQLNNVHFPLIIATSINSRVLLVHPGAQRNIH